MSLSNSHGRANSWQRYDENDWNGIPLIWNNESDSTKHFDFDDSEDSDLLYEPTFPEDTKLLVTDDKKNEGSHNDGRYPRSVFFIIGNEFCERFSYYGLRAILTLYLKSVLNYNDHEAIELFHGFVFLCYFTPVFGAILADGFIGKFKTILYISIIYAIGNVILSLAAVGPLHLPTQAFSILGLGLIAIGTGGIKPCVSSFGGDQFEANQESQLKNFFSVFYFSINAGSVISVFVTPLLRADVKCFGKDTCFPAAFGLPAALMVLSLIIFIFGKSFYKIRPAQGTVITDFVKCIFYAIKNKFTSKTKKAHWLDHSEDKFDRKFIESTKAVVHVLKLFIPIPFFWALFDQLGSRWLIQSTYLDLRIPGTSFYILPDQLGVLNPILIMLFIPLFEFVIYPMLNKIGFLKSPLQRMCAGGFLAAAAFVIGGFVQLKIEATLPLLPGSGHTQLRFINAMPCNITVQTDFINIDLEQNGFNLTSPDIKAATYHIEVLTNNCSTIQNASKIYTENFESEKLYSVIFGLNKNASTNELEMVLLKSEDVTKKSNTGKPLLSVSYFLPTITANSSFSTSDKHTKLALPENTTQNYGSTEFFPVPAGRDKFKLYFPDNLKEKFSSPIAEMVIESGSITRVVVTSTVDVNGALYTISPKNTVPLVLQLPQYFVITAAEILLSITGLQFSYTQAPASMKSVLSAAWLLTVSFGNCIVLIMELIGTLPKPSEEYFLYAGLMAADMILFAFLAYFYKYISDVETNDKIEDAMDEANTSL